MSAIAITPRDLLIKARAYLADESHWTKEAYWLGDMHQPQACCPVGTLETLCLRAGVPMQTAALAEASLAALVGSHDLEGRNDAPGRTHAEILELLDRAIAEAES